jgi:CO/xanthine dehydrogenase FAD-binding subunit
VSQVGGTDLIPNLRAEKIHPAHVLNILEIDQLRGITETDTAVKIGPTTTFTGMIESEVLNRHLPLLVQAAASVGGPQIRNRGTIGGNIATSGPCADVLPAVLALEGRRIVPESVMPVAQRIKAAENVLLGHKPDGSLIDAAAGTLAAEVFKIAGIRWSTEYKEPVLKNVFRRVLQKLL